MKKNSLLIANWHYTMSEHRQRFGFVHERQWLLIIRWAVCSFVCVQEKKTFKYISWFEQNPYFVKLYLLAMIKWFCDVSLIYIPLSTIFQTTEIYFISPLYIRNYKYKLNILILRSKLLAFKHLNFPKITFSPFK